MRMTLLALIAALAVAPAGAHEPELADLLIVQPWARASAGAAATGAVYMKIENRGDRDDRLVSASTPIADKVELHTHAVENGVAKMRAVADIDVAANGWAELKPVGLHFMLIGLNRRLKEHDTFLLTLTFEHAGSVDVEVDVEAVGATGPSK